MLAISDQATAAVIGASAAVAGGIVGGVITYATERTKQRQARRERAADALADMAARYLSAVDQWGAWGTFMVRKQSSMSEEEWRAAREAYNARVTEVRDATVRLQLFCSQDLQSWIADTFRSFTTEVNNAIDEAIESRSGTTQRLDDAMGRFYEGNRELVRRLRDEVASRRES